MTRMLPLLALAVALAGCHREPAATTANSVMVIAPYKTAGTWVFDDPGRGLKAEAFIAGIPEMIDALVAAIPNAEQGFRLTFSAREFPGCTHKLVWRRGDAGGNWYYCPQLAAEGWLCPSLLKYFPAAPAEIYFRADARP